MAKHKYIESPDKLWEHFTNYRKEVKSNPILVEDYVGKDADRVDRKKERALTMTGFSAWLFEQGIIANIWHYFTNPDGVYDEYIDICRACKESIKADQLNGGLAGIYNPSITQRLNNLSEKVEEVRSEGKLPDWMTPD